MGRNDLGEAFHAGHCGENFVWPCNLKIDEFATHAYGQGVKGERFFVSRIGEITTLG